MVESDPQRALLVAKEAEKLSLSSEFENDTFLEEEIENLVIQSTICMSRSDYREGLKLALRSKDKSEKIQPISSIHLQPLRLVANSYFRLGDYPKALAGYQKLLAESQQLGDLQKVISAQNGIGVVHGEMGNYNQAIQQFKLCLKNKENPELTSQSIMFYNMNICSAYRLSGRPKQAISHGLQALQIAEQKTSIEKNDSVDKETCLDLLTLLGSTYTDIGDYEEADAYYQRGLQVATQLESKGAVVSFYWGLAALLLKTERLTEAKKFIEKAIHHVHNFEGESTLFDCYELAAEIAATMGDFEEAYAYHVKFHNLKNKWRGEENAKQIRFLQISHEVEVAQKEAEILQLRTKELEALVKERTTGMLQALEHSELTNTIRSNMITTISHEFRTPMTVINNSSSLLNMHADQLSPEKKAELHGRITNSVQYLSHLLTIVNDVEKSDVARLETSYSSVAMGQWAASLCEFLRDTLEPAQNISFVFDETDQSLVNVDENMTESIVSELLTNALKYTPDNKPITLKLDFTGNSLLFSVKDQGIGIAPHEIDKIFELFYRAHQAGNIPGLGTGLYLTKAMVTALNGEIDVQSDGLDLGTTFSVRLPSHEHLDKP